ncbi:DUF6088 family protein [Undibacterium sp. WLX3042]|uniref:DUF6088 family protein n=1 Tax=Undibacterium sp. WLX3042 TaxID=3412686 RepID=UPI003C2AF533
MKIQTRILSSIRHRQGSVVLRRDVASLGSASQVSKSLNALLMKGVIVRVGVGIYVKSFKDAATGAITLAASAEDIALEVFSKLGVTVRIEQNSVSDAAATNVLKLDTGSHRINRRLSIGRTSVTYVQPHSYKSAHSLTAPLHIPREGISKFVKLLARKHHISYTRTAGDEWAEAVTRLAGDDVRSDGTGDLLVALKRAHKLSDREMTTLLISHQREIRRVRSI